MKLKFRLYIVVNLLISTFGIIMIFIGIVFGSTASRPFFESIGIGLLAAALVNILDRTLTLEPTPQLLQRVEVVAEKRIATPGYIHELKYNVAKVDIVGVSLVHVLEELVNDPAKRIIDALLRDNLQLRLYFVHPDAEFLRQRAIEDKWEMSELVKRQKHAVELSKLLYDELRKAYDAAMENKTLDTHKTGSLEIKLLDFCPYLTIYRVGEEEIYWGLYTSREPGVNLPLFRTTATNDPSLHKHLHQHIHGLRERDKKYPSLVLMPEMGKPELDGEMYSEIIKTA